MKTRFNLTEGEKQIIKLMREVQKDEMDVLTNCPYVAISERGFYVCSSLESDNDGKILSWKQFEDWECNSHEKDFKEKINLLKKSIARMEKKFYQQ